MRALDRGTSPVNQGAIVTRSILVPLALAGVAALVLAIAAPVDAGVVTLQANRDNTLFQDAEGDTSNGAGPAFFAGRNSQGLTRRAVLVFDLSALPANVVIESVTLTLEVTSAPDLQPRGFTLHRLLADWGEGTSSSSGGGGAPAAAGDATWLHTHWPNSFWAEPGGDFEPAPSASLAIGDVGTYEWSSPGMATDVQAWLADPAGDHGWLVRGDESAARTVRRFDSRESSIAPNRPTLTIVYSQPVPTRSATWSALKDRFR